jgi:hypothetical protein
VILRAVAGAARDGRLAGRVEVVDTGESIAVRNVDELLAVLARLAADQDDGVVSGRDPGSPSDIS